MPEEFPDPITPSDEKRRQIIINTWNTAEEEYFDPVTKQWIGSPLGVSLGRTPAEA